jgi:uncharacterized phiE125 gp8 family phage protein
MPLRLLEAPDWPAVSLAQAKGHLRIDHDDEDPLIGLYVEAAIAVLDGADGSLGRALATQRWALDLDGFPVCGPIEIPLSPLQSIEAVTYVDTAGNTQTLDPSDYIVHVGELAMLELVPGGTWPSTSRQLRSVTIAFTAGYGEANEQAGAAAVPKPLQAAVLLMLGDLYENRETVLEGVVSSVPMSTTVDRLISRYRVLRG